MSARSFLGGFCIAFFRDPVRALVAAFWFATGKRVRARNRLHLVLTMPGTAYDRWIAEVEGADLPEDRPADRASGQASPRFNVLICVPDDDAARIIRRQIEALIAQGWPYWTANIFVGADVTMPDLPDDPRIRLLPSMGDGETLKETYPALETQGGYVVPHHQGAILSGSALQRMADAIRGSGNPTIIFGDHDHLAGLNRRHTPWFKPQWNAEMILAQDYVTQVLAIREDEAQALRLDGGSCAAYALLLELSRTPGFTAVRVPHILAHVVDDHAPDASAIRAIVAQHVAHRAGIATAGPFGTVRVAWPLPDPLPLVSVIVPTRDQPRLLRACMDGLLRDTLYAPMEILVVDNGTTDRQALALIREHSADPRVRVLSAPGPYNYSRLNNRAVREAAGEYVCLLNNDTQVIKGTWLHEMMRQASRPEAGAVGAMLLYPDHTIQHAGVVVGMGEAAGHAHRFQSADGAGFFAQAHVQRYVSAVTAACLVVKREKFLAVDGLDEEGLPIAFNDVDLCLKLQREGWRNLYCPQAVMVHHESKSRGKDFAPDQRDRYMRELSVLQGRWGTARYQDPLHHPRLKRSSETYILDY